LRGLCRRPVSDCCGLDSLLDLHSGKVLGFYGVDLERLCGLCRGPVSNVVGRLRLQPVHRGRIARIDGIILDQRVCRLRDRPVRRFLWPIGLRGLRSRKVQFGDRLYGLRDVFRRNVRRFDGLFGVPYLRSRNEFNCRVERLHGLPGRDLPSHDGRVGLHELLVGDLFCFRGERMPHLRGRPIPDHGRLDGLFPVRCRLVFECRGRVGFGCMRNMLSGLLFGRIGTFVHCLRRRQLCGRRRRVKLQHLSRRLIRSELWHFGLYDLRRWDISDRQRADAGGAHSIKQLHRVRGGDILDGDGGGGVDRVFSLCRRPLRRRHFSDVVRRVFRRPVRRERRRVGVCELRGGPIPDQ
jgi:hypothetical protein